MRFFVRMMMPFALVMSVALTAQAQMWGAGLYGGMQGCNMQNAVGPAASSYLDEINEAQQAIQDARRLISQKKNELRRAEREAERHEKAIRGVIDDGYADCIIAHIQDNARCQEYSGNVGNEPIVTGTEGYQGSIVSPVAGNRSPAGVGAGATPSPDEGAYVPEPGYENNLPTQPTPPISSLDPYIPITGNRPLCSPFTQPLWNGSCDPNKSGSFQARTCDLAALRGERTRYRAQDCKKGLTEYRKNYHNISKLQGEIENLEASIERFREDMKFAKEGFQDEIRNQTEAGICYECMAQGSGYTSQRSSGTDWGSVIGNLGVGLAATYMGYKTNQMISDNNAALGWPTQSYPAIGYGFPYIAQGVQQMLGGGSGIYGAVNGGIGAGSMACSGMNGGVNGIYGPFGGMNGGGMWGNPHAMGGMGGMGGGIFMPGMGPWGMAGPWGMGGPYPGAMGYPMAGGMMGMPMGNMIGAGGIIGAGGMMGMPMGGMAGSMMGMPMGNMMGGMMGMPMGGMAGGMMGMPMGGMAGSMMGMPMGSMIGAGGIIGAGGMMGMPMGGMAGGMMGMPMGSMMGMAMGGMAGGMMGMPMGSMMGMAMGGMAGGMMGMPMGSMTGVGGMDMYQQMMQMQMQQYQTMMQAQQQYMQQQMQKQQMIASLQQEMYGLMYRIQAIQYGSSTGVLGGTLGTSYIGSPTTSNPGGISTLPVPGGSGGVNILPGGTTAPVPAAR